MGSQGHHGDSLRILVVGVAIVLAACGSDSSDDSSALDSDAQGPEDILLDATTGDSDADAQGSEETLPDGMTIDPSDYARSFADENSATYDPDDLVENTAFEYAIDFDAMTAQLIEGSGAPGNVLSLLETSASVVEKDVGVVTVTHARRAFPSLFP